MSSEIINVVVTGIGGRGSWAAKKLRAEPGFNLVALCEKNPGKLAFFQQQEGISDLPGFANFADCLTQIDFEAVVVTTPDGHHAEIVLPALAAGKYVFVEKPLEISVEKCRAIIDADAAAGGKTWVGFNLRFAPVYVKIKELIDRGVLGKILTIQADEFYDGGRTYFRRWNRLREVGGGLWITKACHDFDLLCWLAGETPLALNAFDGLNYYRPRADATLFCADCPHNETCPDSYFGIKRREGVTEKLLAEVGAEFGDPRPDLCLFNSDKNTFDHGIASVEFNHGILGTYTCNVVTGFSDRRIRVSGTRGTVDGSLETGKLRLQRRDPSGVEEIDAAAETAAHGGGDNYIFQSFRNFILGADSPCVRPAEAIIPVLLGLAANRSSDEKRRVALTEFGWR
jgi:predicted dehydrogenase